MFQSKRCAFTLLELLAVLLIIAILLSLMFVGFSRARQLAGLATCSNNNKNLGLAQYLFAANSKRITGASKSGYWGTVSWDDQLAPYTGRTLTTAEINKDGLDQETAQRIGNKILECPGDIQPRHNNDAMRSYALNEGQATQQQILFRRGVASGGWGVRVATVAKPSDCLLMSERNSLNGPTCFNRAGSSMSLVLGSITYSGASTLGQWGSNNGLGNHGKGRDYKVALFIDQHVTYVTAQSVWDSRLHWSGIAKWGDATSAPFD